MTKTAVVFPGAGSQQFGMEQSLLHHFPNSRKLYQQASEILNQDLLRFVTDKDAYQANQPLAAVSLLIYSYAYFQQLKQRQPIDYVLGLSSGQITGALASGMLSFSAAVKLCYNFTKCDEQLDSNKSGLLISNGLAVEKVKTIVQQNPFECYLATVNSPVNVVVGVTAECLPSLMESLKTAGAKVKQITGMPAFHTPLVQPLLPAMKAILTPTTVPLSPSTIPFLSDLDGQWNQPNNLREKLILQDVSPSNLADNIQQVLDLDVTHFWVLVPGHRLTELVSANLTEQSPNVTVHSINELF